MLLRLHLSVQAAASLSTPVHSSCDRRAGSQLCLRHGERDPAGKHINEPKHWYVTHTNINQGDFCTSQINIHQNQPFDITGQPFLNPDGTPAVYNPPDSQQPVRSQTASQLQGSPSQQQQQQQVNSQQEVCYVHTDTHTCHCLCLYLCFHMCVSQVVQYSSVSYTAPQMLPVTPSQPYSTVCITDNRRTCLFSVILYVCGHPCACSFPFTSRWTISPHSLLM